LLTFTSTFASLSVRNYRLYFIGQLISVSGTWMQTVAQAFLVLDLTHSGTQLGLSTAARFAPVLLAGPWGGVIVDRTNTRRLLLATQATSGAIALAFAILVGLHAAQMWQVYILALALGWVNVFDNPARQTFISELVPARLLSNAVTLNSVMVNGSRILGASAGGALAAGLGLALCFGANALSYAAVIGTILAMSTKQLLAVDKAGPEKGQASAGLRYVRSRPDLLIPLLMVALVGALAWEFQISLPLLASQTFHGGAGTYGAMASVMAVGAVVGGLITASRTARGTRSLAVSAIGWGVSITAAALAWSLPVEFAFLLFVGYGSVTFNSLAKTVMQLGSAPQMRGRVMALWGLAWLGSTPVGGSLVGWVGQELGARWSLLIGGLPTLITGLIAYPLLARLDRARVVADADDRSLRRELL
jgi:MFS family permease